MLGMVILQQQVTFKYCLGNGIVAKVHCVQKKVPQKMLNYLKCRRLSILEKRGDVHFDIYQRVPREAYICKG